MIFKRKQLLQWVHEGHAKTCESAKFGEAILTRLRDKDLVVLGKK